MAKKKQNFNPWMLTTFILFALIIGFAAGSLSGGGFSFNFGGESEFGEIKLSGRTGGGVEATLGSPDAPVVIEEYSDYQCPYCQRFYTQTLGELEKNYIETGKVRLVYKDFPLSFHANAAPAAVAAYCAGEQDNYWGMHDALYLNLSLWSKAEDANGVFKAIAKELKLNKKKFAECIESGRYDDKITANQAEGVRAGISGTPGFLVNGQKVVGAQPFAVFKALIDAELEGGAAEEAADAS